MNKHYAIAVQETATNLDIVSMYISTVDRNYSNYFSGYNKPLSNFNRFIGFIQTVEGEGLLKTSHGDFSLTPNSLIFVNYQDCEGIFSNSDKWTFYCVWFHCKNIPIDFYEIYHIDPFPDEETHLVEIIKLAKKTEYLDVCKANGLALVFLCDLIKHINKNNSSVPLEFIKNIKTYIEENLNNDLKIKAIAKHFGYCENQFCNIFKKHFRISPKQYILDKKIKEAAFLLSFTNKSITCISDELRFSTPSYFSSLFKTKYKQTPSEYRETHNFYNFKKN